MKKWGLSKALVLIEIFKKYEKSLNLNEFGKTGKEMEEIGYEGKSH